MFKVSAVPPRRSAMLTVFRGATAINDGTTAEPLRPWRCNFGLCRTSTAEAPRLRCDGGRRSAVIPPSHRRRGATAVLVRHKPQWHRHDRRDSTVVPSLIVAAPRTTVKTADLRGGTAATFNMFRGASAVLVPPHRGRGATAVRVRHKPHWHRHDRRGSASDCRSTAENGQHCGPSRGHGGNFEHVQNFRRPPRVGPIRSWIAAAPPWHRHDRRGTVQEPQ